MYPAESDRRRLRALALLAPHGSLRLEPVEATTELGDAASSHAAVALELRLAGAARPHAGANRPASPAEALEVLPHPAHARQVVLELCELDLELALGRDGVLREDVEDQLGSVDDAGLESVLELTLLGRVELAVDEEDVRAALGERLLDLDELPLAHVRPGIRVRAMLHDLGDGLDERGARELADLGELVLAVDALREHGEHEPELGPVARLRIRSRRRH